MKLLTMKTTEKQVIVEDVGEVVGALVISSEEDETKARSLLKQLLHVVEDKDEEGKKEILAMFTELLGI